MHRADVPGPDPGPSVAVVSYLPHKPCLIYTVPRLLPRKSF